MTDETRETFTYDRAGVKSANIASGMAGVVELVRKTFAIRPAVLDLGYFAGVIDIGGGLGLAISTDGVGTKILVAEAMGRFDTVGIDCVAMNANDVVCVGAKPLAMVDYIAVQEMKDDLLNQLAAGLYEGARLARINIPAGEIAQLPEMISGAKPGYGFDLVGTCVGTVPLDKIIIGRDVAPGDVVIALASSGIHSNGLTLARKVLFGRMKLKIDAYVDELGRTVGEELLEPTAIYVPEAMEMLEAGLAVKSFCHITGDGLLNLARTEAKVGFEITEIPPVPPIFSLIAEGGPVEPEEMWRVFNMGIGFCAVVDKHDADRALQIAGRNRRALTIGRVVEDPEQRISIKPLGLVGSLKTHFRKA